MARPRRWNWCTVKKTKSTDLGFIYTVECLCGDVLCGFEDEIGKMSHAKSCKPRRPYEYAKDDEPVLTNRLCRKCNKRLYADRYFNHAECEPSTDSYDEFDYGVEEISLISTRYISPSEMSYMC